jgi:hypothetical protein
MKLADGEEPPNNVARHKSHYNKAMFLAAVARPWVSNRCLDLTTTKSGEYNANVIDNDVNKWFFDGKIGIYPLVEQCAAKRKSCLRPAGTMVPTAVSMTRAVYKEFVFEKLLPDIARKCPWQMRKQTIWIQHDNAPPHRINERELKIRCDQLGVDCRFYYQPAQSPDLNLCDLSFFPAIQSLFYKIESERTLAAIVSAVTSAFEIYDPNNLNRGFLSLMMNYNKVLEHDGSNFYKFPHMAKKKLERLGTLPLTLKAWESEATATCDEGINIPTCYIENVENSVLDDLPDDGWLLNSGSNNDGMDELADCFFRELDIVDNSFDNGEAEGNDCGGMIEL